MGGRPATHPAARDLFALPRRRRQAQWCVRPTCSCPTPTSVVAPLGRALAHARLRRGECRHGRWPFTPSCPLRRRTRRLEPTPPPRPPVSCWTTRGRLARRTHHAHGTRGTYVIVFGVVSFRYPPLSQMPVLVPQVSAIKAHRFSMFPSRAMSRLSSRRDGKLANMRYQAKNEPKPRCS